MYVATSHHSRMGTNMSLSPVGVSAVVPRPALKAGHFPSFFHRVGFTAFFGFAAYALAEGDARNGSGIATGASYY